MAVREHDLCHGTIEVYKNNEVSVRFNRTR